MSRFIGRERELSTLHRLMEKKSASLVVVKGRRRIGKSRMIEEFAHRERLDAFYLVSGIPKTPQTTAQSQRDVFAVQLGATLGLSGIDSTDWAVLFRLLAERAQGKVLILFDEISWMGSEDPDFLGKLKNAWDTLFKKNDRLILVLCGSVSTWIEKNILSSTGFLGRISLDFSLKELSLKDCAEFWGTHAKHISAYEKYKFLAVTGGVPLYLEHMNPTLSAEENIFSLCFRPTGLLFREFDNIFSDLFSKKSAVYKSILEALSEGSKSQEDICDAMKRKNTKKIREYLEDLIKSGFAKRDYNWNMRTGKRSRDSKYRICDNYSRFYLKYIAPMKHKIEEGQFKSVSFAALPKWSTMMGLQFESLVLNNRALLWDLLNIVPESIIFDNPYFQSPTKRHRGCQVDYLIQVRFNYCYLCEIKFSQREIGKEIIREIEEKISALAIPKKFSIRPVLIQVNGITEELEESGFFAHIINFGDLLCGSSSMNQ
jgi:uncharacterized protein